MTDKVQKIKEWISKTQDGLMDAQGNFGYPEHEGAYHILCNLDYYIDSLQEEPVSEDEIEKSFSAGDVVVYVSRHPAYSGLYLLGNPNDLSIGYTNANEPYNIALRNCTKASEEECNQFMRELNLNGYKWNENTLRIEKIKEPISEELKVELEKYIKDHFTIDTEQLDRFGIEEKDYMYSMDKSDMLALVEHFINWHKTKEEPVSEELEEAAINHAATGEFLDNGKEMIDFQKEKSFKAGAKWKEKRIIEKVCEWIEETNRYSAPTNFNVENFKAYLKNYC